MTDESRVVQLDCPNASKLYHECSEYCSANRKKRKLFELRLKMNEARKTNQSAMVAEKEKTESQKWIEEMKKIGKLLDANGLDMSKAYMLDTRESAEAKYKKEPAPAGNWDAFNQKTTRTKNEVAFEYNNRMKESSGLLYGQAPKLSEEKIERMVKELKERDEKRQSFSRRRKFHEEKYLDSINDHNEHFNKKIERAFGKYTLDIKKSLERGTALPD